MKRLITLLLVAIFTVSLSVPAFAVTSAVKESEPNDTRNQVRTTEMNSPYEDNLRVFGAVNANDTTDWFTIMQTGVSIIGTVTFQGSPDCTYQLDIFDSAMQYRGIMVTTNNSREYFYNLVLPANSPYYFNVKLISGTPNEPYEFQIYGSPFTPSLISEIKDEAVLQELRELNIIDNENKLIEE